MKQIKNSSLVGKLLIATPHVEDSRFDRSVIYICSHSKDGTMGLVINKPIDGLGFDDVLKRLKIKPLRPITGVDIHFGGPVERECGFVLHSTDYKTGAETLAVNETFGMTASLDILEDISRGQGPLQKLFTLGYAGWNAGQLEAELSGGGWLLTEGNYRLVFEVANDDKWGAAMHSIGVDPRVLSGVSGRA